jgi:hypothetical protein
MKLLGIIARFDITGKVLITFSAFSRPGEKKWEYSETVCQLFIDFETRKPMIQLGR